MRNMALDVDTDELETPDPACPVDCAMRAFGSRASILILRQAFYGDRRFDAFVRHTGVSEATVAKRLQELVDVGVLRKVPYRDPGARERHEYELTAAGQELLPVILGLFTWGQRHLPGTNGGVRLTDAAGQPVKISVQTADGRPLHPDELRMTWRSA